MPPRSPSCLSTTSTVSGAPWSMCQPSTSGSTAAPRLSRFMIHRYRPPAARNRSSSPAAASASGRSPWPVAWMLGRPSSPRNRQPSGVSRSEAPCTKASTRSPSIRPPSASRMGPSVAWLVISHIGSCAPLVRCQYSRSARRASRNVAPGIASTRPLTTPPMRVAMPPASTTMASRPSPRASSPRRSSRLPSSEPRSGRSTTSPAAGGATTPATRFTSGPARSRSRSHAAQALGVEALALELGEQGRIEAGQVVVQAGVRQTGRAGGARRAR